MESSNDRSLKRPDSRQIDPCIRLGLFLIGTLDSELLCSIVGVQLRMPRGDNTQKTVMTRRSY